MTDWINSYPLLPDKCSFLECFNGPISILLDISKTLIQSHKTTICEVYLKDHK